MARYYYEKGANKVYIKDIDFAKGKLEFTEDAHKAYVGRDGFYAKPLRDQIKRLFVEDYPEVEKLQVDAAYY